MKKLKLEALGRLSIVDYKDAKKNDIIIVLDNIRSMHNVGSAFRTADAFRVKEIFLTGITAKPPHRDINKTALGATDSVDWTYFDDTCQAIDKALNNGYKIIAVEHTNVSIPIHKMAINQGDKFCLVFGNEVSGISQEALDLAERAVEIPQEGTKHSMNVSVCVGIVLWEIWHRIS